MEKRVIFAFVLSIAVVWAFQSLFRPAVPNAPAATDQPAAPAVTPTPPAATGTPQAEPIPSASEGAPATDLAASAPEDLVIDTTLYSATVSNVGGVLKSFRLKAYTDAQGKPIELVNQASAVKFGWPLTAVSGDARIDPLLAQSNFSVEREGTTVRFEFARQGLHALKVLRFDPGNYLVDVESAITSDGAKVAHRVVWQGGFGDQSLPPDPARTLAVVGTDAKFESLALNGIEGVMERTTPIVGVEDKYFLAAFILPESGNVHLTKQDFTGPDAKVIGTISLAVPAGEKPVRVYVGPKDENWLGKVDPRLTRVVNYGFFEIITRPLLAALLWIHSYIGNFGWAIILLTLVINLLLFPLRLKQQVAMQKMQKLQPHMRTLQDRYKKLKSSDPRRAEVQMEMMNLYKQHGVNPMGGCLPLLLQMPLLFAFWNMLAVSIDLRQAPWILWIKDLSEYDPYFIIPILMAVSMIISQKMTPTTVDPAQAKMMMIMPVLLTVMFLWLQSGVTLYYLTSNVVGIGQQWFIKKYWSGDNDAKPQRGKNKAIEAGDA